MLTFTARATERRGFRAYATKPHDGDSFWVVCDTGFGGRHEPELRLLDVHAPELRPMALPPVFQPGGADTTNFVNDWMASVNVGSVRRWWLWVETILSTAYEPNERMTLSRYLAVVWPYDQRPAALGTPPDDTLSLNHAVAAYLAGHPDWPSGD
jgi:hypothetical protein